MNNITFPYKHNFTAVEGLSYENSFCVLKQEDNINLEVIVGINDEKHGWFEIMDEETQGNEWYAEGNLWIEDKKITDYDGIFALPRCVINHLKEIGYDVSEVE